MKRDTNTIIEEIERLIQEHIQPAVAMHGGVVTLTLKNGIEGMLKHYIPEVIRVEGVDDENSEVAPYYT